jgi:RNA polymerase sigma-70 factor (ECF subfamily)
VTAPSTIPPLVGADAAITVERVLRDHGQEIFGWMLASLPAESDAADAFSLFSEDLWRSLARYDGRCSMRTWCYMLARHAVSRIANASRAMPEGARAIPISQAPVSRIAAELRERTVEHLRSDVKAKVRALREHLDPEDQMLLVLRVDKDLAWRDISMVFLGDAADDDELARHAALLRKRFERVKTKLRSLVSGVIAGDEAAP